MRDLARKLAEDSSEAANVRKVVESAVADTNDNEGRIWRALRRSPLVGAGVEFERLRAKPRELEL